MNRIESAKISPRNLQFNQKNAKSSQNYCGKVAFGQDENQTTVSGQDGEKKKGFTFKEFTNILGVVLGVGAVGGYIVTQSRRPKDQKILDKLEKSTKLTDNLYEEFKEFFASIKQAKTNLGFKFGKFCNKLSEQNKELFNNVVYGIGTTVIMPLVILFSPIGKDKSSKQDRFFTILRQPLSFATLFSIQLTVDKFLKGITPKFIKKNLFEDKDIMKEDGKTIDVEKLKYNSDLYKTDFTDELKQCTDLHRSEINDLFKIEDLNTAKEQMQKRIGAADFKKIEARLDKYFKVKGKEKLLSEGIVILTNVLFSAPVGCTLLNVIYGKSMKKIKPLLPKDTQNENLAKGGHA